MHKSSETDPIVIQQPKEHSALVKYLSRYMDEKRAIQLHSYILIVTSAFLYSLWAIFSKFAKELDPLDQSIIRFLVEAIVLIPIILYLRLPFFGSPGSYLLLFVRSLVGIGIIIIKQYAIYFLDPAIVFSILNASVIVTLLLGRVFLSEKFRLNYFIGVGLTITGIALLFKREQTLAQQQEIDLSLRYVGISLALVGALLLGVDSVLFKKIHAFKVHYSVVVMYPVYVGLPLALVPAVAKLVHDGSFMSVATHPPAQTFYSVLASLFGMGSVAIFFVSLQDQETGLLAIVRNVYVVFSFALQYLFLHIGLDVLSFMGSVCIVTATTLVLLFNIYENKLENMNNRFCKFFIYKF